MTGPADERTADQAEGGRPAGAPRRRSRVTTPAGRARSERRASRLAARRRRRLARLLRLVIPIAVLAGIAVALVLLLPGESGGGGGAAGSATPSTSAVVDAAAPSATAGVVSESGAAPTVTTIAPAASVQAGLAVLLTQDGQTAALTVIRERTGGGVVMALPADTLLRTATAFTTVAQLHASGEVEVVRSSLAGIFGETPLALGVLEWSTLRDLLAEGDVGPQPAEGMPAGDDGLREIAAAVLDLVRLFPDLDSDAWDRAVPDRGADLLAEEGARLAGVVDAGTWAVESLPGQQRQGTGFAYWEPDLAMTRVLVTGGGSAPGAELSVLNGSGVVGHAESAAALLEPLAYSLQPFGNAPGFPNVEQTTISAYPGGRAAAEEVRDLLGVGVVVEDEAVGQGDIVVVVGKDFAPPELRGEGPSQDDGTTDTTGRTS